MAERIKTDVAVVGAGISGLTAARRLDQAGVDVCLVEAADHIGGRLLNLEVAPGVFNEVGGRFVGTDQGHTLGLIEELGATTFDVYTWGGEPVWHFDGERTVGGELPMSAESSAIYERAWAELGSLASRITPSEPWNAPEAQALDRVTFESWLVEHVPDERARWALLFDLIIAWALPPWRVSLLYVAQTLAAAGGVDGLAEADHMRIVGGGAGLCEVMADELGEKVHLSAPAELIGWGPEGVTVKSRELTVEARQCIVAMSPADARWINFEPGLPWDRDTLHRHYLMGGGMMTVLVYETPFWREEGLSGRAVTDLPAGGNLNDNSPADGQVGVINSFITPLPAGMPWGTPRGALDTPEDRRRALTAAAVEAFGERAAHPINYFEKDWMNRRFISGVQSGMPPGLITETGPAIFSSEGPLHWCSTEHGTRWALTMNGAIESGERVAAEIKQLL